ncbi:MAG TPA: hypothetical protein DEP69_03705, partial [Acidimicrobiaceae bacterium]|nr:hypothetical protein [Acidimicrobiaceae bacterium]
DSPARGTPPAGSVAVAAGETVSRRIPAQPLRAVSVWFDEDLVTADTSARLRLDVTTPDGTVLTGYRAVRGLLPAGWHWVPVAGEEIPGGDGAGGDMTVSLTHVADDGTMHVGTSAAGVPTVFVMKPADDGLRLAHTSGVAVWENVDAVERVRFAPLAVVVPERAERLALLSQPWPADIVVLTDQAPHANPATAATGRVVAVADTIDEMSVVVESDGPGYLVVADAMQHGWNATVDGVAAPVLAADHAVVAVPVPAGRSEVRLVYDPPGLATGTAVTAASAVVVLGLAVVPPAYRRRQRRQRGARPTRV